MSSFTLIEKYLQKTLFLLTWQYYEKFFWQLILTCLLSSILGQIFFTSFWIFFVFFTSLFIILHLKYSPFSPPSRETTASYLDQFYQLSSRVRTSHYVFLEKKKSPFRENLWKDTEEKLCSVWSEQKIKKALHVLRKHYSISCLFLVLTKLFLCSSLPPPLSSSEKKIVRALSDEISILAENSKSSFVIPDSVEELREISQKKFVVRKEIQEVFQKILEQASLENQNPLSQKISSQIEQHLGLPKNSKIEQIAQKISELSPEKLHSLEKYISHELSSLVNKTDGIGKISKLDKIAWEKVIAVQEKSEIIRAWKKLEQSLREEERKTKKQSIARIRQGYDKMALRLQWPSFSESFPSLQQNFFSLNNSFPSVSTNSFSFPHEKIVSEFSSPEKFSHWSNDMTKGWWPQHYHDSISKYFEEKEKEFNSSNSKSHLGERKN